MKLFISVIIILFLYNNFFIDFPNNNKLSAVFFKYSFNPLIIIYSNKKWVGENEQTYPPEGGQMYIVNICYQI